LISTFTTFFTVPIIILLPFYVEDFLKAAPDWYGFLLAAYGAGAMIGYVLAGSFQLSGQARAKLMMLAIVLESVGYILLGLVRDPATAVGMAALGGIASGFVGVNITTILQISTPSAIRGRVFGLLSTVAGSLAPLAMGLAGVVADLVDQNIPLIYLACGVMLTVLSLLVLLNPDVRSFLAYEGEEEPAPAGVEHLVAPVPWEP
jgi:MFS family permease